MKNTILIGILATVAACGSSSTMNGKYADADHTMEIEFKDAPNATISAGGHTLLATYKLTGDTIVITDSDGSANLTLRPDGTLAGGPFGPMKKQGS